MTWTPLDESITAGQAGHITDHEAIHASWNNAHVQKVSSNLTLDYDYSAVVIDSGAATRTVTLPATDGTSIDGHVFLVKRKGANTVTVDCAGSDEFDDGTTSKVLFSDGATIGLMSVADGTWYVTGEWGTVT